jgi:hypothetical protein
MGSHPARVARTGYSHLFFGLIVTVTVVLGDTRAVEPLLTIFQELRVRFNKLAKELSLLESKTFHPRVITIRDLLKGLEERATPVVDALGQIGDPRAVDPLINALNGPHMSVGSIAKALGQIGDPRAVDPLVTMVIVTRSGASEAAEALRQIGDPRAVESLINALNKPNRWSVGSIAKALRQIGDPRAVEPLVTTLLDDELGGIPPFGTDIARALGQIGDPSAVKLLLPVTGTRLAEKYWLVTVNLALQLLLERSAFRIALEDLRAMTILSDTIRISDNRTACGGSIEERPVSYAYVRQLARQELIRRRLEA